MTSTSQLQPTPIVGREREQGLLSAALGEARAGRGALVLIGGVAGIGKTALVRFCRASAIEHGFLALTGACYDTGTPPPYGPWRELTAAPARDDRPIDEALLTSAPNPEAFVAELRRNLETLAQRGPLLLVLEDVHWSDPESLEFLRVFARGAGALPLLLVATYRDDEVHLNQALYQALPHLVREANAQRINLSPLDAVAIQLLVEGRYELTEPDLLRLTTHLGGRGQGVPLYLLELLRALEEEQRLRRSAGGWTLEELPLSQVPPLVRQVIDGRLTRLGPEVRRLLELAAVVGQDVPMLFWRRIGGASDELFDEAVERALETHVLEEASSGLDLQFTHALVRDALYAGISLPQRRRLHRQVAEALADGAGVEPDMVAHHFRQALDPRAAEWYIRAGSRVERVARVTAASYFELALDMLGGGSADPGQRGWLLLRRAFLLVSAEPRTALVLLDSASALADDAGDAVLRAYVCFARGSVLCLVGEMRAGMVDLEASVVGLSRLTPSDVERLGELERQGVIRGRTYVIGHEAALVAMVGRVNDAIVRAEAIIAQADDIPILAWLASAIAFSLAGRLTEAREAFVTAKLAFEQVSDMDVAIVLLYHLILAQLPYGADDLPERSRIAREGEAAWRRAGGDLGEISPRIAWLPLLLIEGDWVAARELALNGRLAGDATSEKHLISTVALARLTAAQGQTTFAWEIVHGLLPSGPQTVPGHVDFEPSMALMRVAVTLCLDHDDLVGAHAWLEAHDRWLVWSGAALGRADGQNSWAAYALATGDHPLARRRATQALALAESPRQPLALLTAHRLAGVVESHAGRIVEARQHLDAALALADACRAQYERALTQLAAADLGLRAGAIDQAEAALDEARSVFTRLGAAPALARVEALATRLSDQSIVMERIAPAGLSPREIEVLQLVASGRNNREIAETLFLSVRTVERHITNLYAKIGAEGRNDAVAFARLHDLI